MRKLTLGIALSLLILVAVPAKSYGQRDSTANDPVIKACEQAIDELKVRRVEVEGLKQQIVLRDERDKLRDQFESNQAEQIAFWKEAATARKEALSIDDRIEAIRMTQISEYKEEITRLRLENEKLRRSRTKWLMAGVFGGILIPKLP